MPAGPVLFTSDQWEVRTLSVGLDLSSVESFCARCEDYYRLHGGEPADAAEARQIFEEVPAGLTPADKIVLGIFGPAPRLAGIIEVLRGYRQPRDWYIGLLLLEPGARGRGIGGALHGEFVLWARTRGVERLLLAVLEENARARKFWQEQGYRRREVFPPRVIGRKTHVLEEMELPLGASADTFRAAIPVPFIPGIP